MKTISDGLKTHLAGSVTSLSTCWKITRRDGQIFAFTDHDQNLEIAGQLYLAATGYTRAALTADLTMKVDSLNVDGVLSDDSITSDDMKAGLYDFAAVEIFLVNWSDLSMGQLNLRSGWFGEVIIMPTGMFKTEIRGLSNTLIMNVGQSYTELCRADLGDTHCKQPIAPAAWTPVTAVVASKLMTLDVTATLVSDPNPTDDAHALAVYQCLGSGSTAETQPDFDPTIGAVTTETTGVQWVSVTPLRGVGLVVSSTSNSNAVVSGIALPSGETGSIASVTFSNTPQYPITIVLTVGSVSNSFPMQWNYSSQECVEALTGGINAADMGAVATNQFKAGGVNSSIITVADPTVTCSVTKENDPLDVCVITNFEGAGSDGSPYFQGGFITWVTGANAGTSMEMKSWTPGSGDQGTMQLFLNMPFPMQPGDKFYWAPGCDKTRDTCFYRFNNMDNYRGEPDLPGAAAMLVSGNSNTGFGAGGKG